MLRLAPSGDALQLDPSEKTSRGLESTTESAVLTCLIAECSAGGGVGSAQHPPNHKVSMAFADETGDVFSFNPVLRTQELILDTLAYIKHEIASAWSLEFSVWPGRQGCLETTLTTGR
jgi:hypothetical protein